MDAPVTYELDDAIATLTMDDGKVNVMSRQMLGSLNDALDQAEAEGAAVVLTGRPGVFSAGFDMPVLAGGGADALDMLMTGFLLAERLLSFPAPVVIACPGHALAMGVFLVLSGDYRIAADGAYKVGANEVAIGLTLPHTAVELCRQRLAPSHFHRAAINAEIYAPADAVAAGFLDRVVPEADLRHEARRQAERLGSLDRSAHAATKRRVRADALTRLRAAIEADDTEFRERMG